MTGIEAAGVAAAADHLQGAARDSRRGAAKDRDAIREIARETKGMEVAANSYADRLAVRQRVIDKLWKPLYWFADYRSEYFENDFDADMAEKLADVPEENLVSPKPVVAAQALEGLSYSFDEAELKEMYLNLLKSSSDDRVSGSTHPSFAAIIKNLSAEEAPLLLEVLQVASQPIVQLRHVQELSYLIQATHILDCKSTTTGESVVVPGLATFIDNWIRLGLVSVTYQDYRADEGAYAWAGSRPEYATVEASAPEGWKAEVQKGLLRSTAFGASFATSVAPSSTTD